MYFLWRMLEFLVYHLVTVNIGFQMYKHESASDIIDISLRLKCLVICRLYDQKMPHGMFRYVTYWYSHNAITRWTVMYEGTADGYFMFYLDFSFFSGTCFARTNTTFAVFQSNMRSAHPLWSFCYKAHILRRKDQVQCYTCYTLMALMLHPVT